MRYCGEGKEAMTEAEELLVDLARTLDTAFISTWQSTAAWQKELNAALAYIKENGLAS